MANAKEAPSTGAPSTVSAFNIKGKRYEIDVDPSKLTWGEIEDLEVYFDRPLEDVNLDSARATMFLAYLAKRRKDPTTTLDEIRALSVNQIEGEDAPKRPTGSPRAKSGKPAS